MELEIIKHENILFKDLLRVIDIKNAAWPHPIESQLKWILGNQNSEDLHVILKDAGEDLAYMDLCPVRAKIDDMDQAFLGIGNVCTKTHGLGHGGILMKEVNKYIEVNGQKGILFCREGVLKFYVHHGWKVIASDKVIIEGEEHADVFTMCYNSPSFNRMIYSDRLF